MTSCWLLLGMLSWWTPACLASPAHRTQTLAQHYASVSSYPFSKVVGVFSVVDETSCSCVLASSPCPLEITEKSTLKTRGLPCPWQTRYCCWRKILRNLFNNSSTGSAERQQLSSNVSHAPVTVPTERQGHSGSVSPRLMNIPVKRQRYDTKLKSSRETADDQGSDKAFWLPSDFNRTFVVSGGPGLQSGKVRDTDSSNPQAIISEVSTSKTPLTTILTTTQDAEKHPSDVFRPPRNEDSQRRPKTAACSCMTREDCINSWSLFGDLPEVEIKTSLECEKPELACCLGRVLPARSGSSPEQRRRGRPTPASSVWRPLQTTWDSLVSWFIG
ncbi:uncharacterized protein [Procambarus clarkii]|uniref:uncharacterized protein n=1 Tax=Procambarus clarkii TaxID=6728 RepID=UPI0037429E0F